MLGLEGNGSGHGRDKGIDDARDLADELSRARHSSDSD